MGSEIFSLTKSDAVRSAISAIFAAVVIAVYGVVTQSGFDLFTADWGMIGHMAINAAFAAFVGDLGRRFMSDGNGTLHTPLGAIG